MEYNVSMFKQMLLEENQRQNLVSRKTCQEELDKHIEDSLAALKRMDLKGKRLVDIGSGAGFPGLVLAMHCPQCIVTLLEADLKKSRFLVEVVNRLSLANVNVVRLRAEEMGQDIEHRAQYDVCTCRAVAAIRVLLEYALPLLRIGGEAVFWKGKNYQEEKTEAAGALATLGGEWAEVHSYSLIQDIDRFLVVIKKTRPTPEGYPRRTGIPAKRPI